jgi:hypothetical protein
LFETILLAYSIRKGVEGELTFLVRLRALISDAAGHVVQEGLGLADALEINATVLGDCTCSA